VRHVGVDVVAHLVEFVFQEVDVLEFVQIFEAVLHVAKSVQRLEVFQRNVVEVVFGQRGAVRRGLVIQCGNVFGVLVVSVIKISKIIVAIFIIFRFICFL